MKQYFVGKERKIKKRHFISVYAFFVYDIPQGIKNVIRWFPIIWKDRNWDSYYIHVILRHKLHLTEQCIRKNNNHTQAIQDANKIKKCVILLDRIIKDNYLENAFINHDKKWGKLIFNFEPCKNRPNCNTLNINRKNIITEDDKKQERKESDILYKHAENLKKQDLDLLYNTVKKHIQGWWD